MGTNSPLDDNLTIGNYEIIEKLGGRNSGAVYRGLDPELGRAVVIRVLRDDISWTPGLEERFRRDYASVAGIKHPNIAAVYDIGKEGAFPYIATESLGARNIKRLVGERAELRVETKLSMLIQAATGLSHAHKNGVLHLDLTPSKIHVTPIDTVKIRDFTLANLLAQYPPLPAPAAPSVYAAPETAGMSVGTEQADIYALGAIFYEFFTFLRPERDAAGEMQFPDFDQIAEIPPGLWIILKTCLEQNPNDRYRNMDDLVASAKELLDSLAEDKRLMQTELYAAIEPLRQFASRLGASSEESLAAHRLLNEIQQLANGESEAHYAQLDRLMNALIAQYPKFTGKQDALSDMTPEAQKIAPPLVGMRSEATDASPEETLGVDSGATASDDVQAAAVAGLGLSAAVPVPEEPAAKVPELPEKAAVEAAVPQEVVTVTPPVASPSAIPPANGAGNLSGFGNLSTVETETTYSNFDVLMDELIQTHPKLQDIDSGADFEMYTPPWAATPPVPATEPAPAAKLPVAQPPSVATSEPPKAPPTPVLPSPVFPTPAPVINKTEAPVAALKPVAPSIPEWKPPVVTATPAAESQPSPQPKLESVPALASFQDQLQLVTNKERTKEQLEQEMSFSSFATVSNPNRPRPPKPPKPQKTDNPVPANPPQESSGNPPMQWKKWVILVVVPVLLIMGIGFLLKSSNPKPAESKEQSGGVTFAAPPVTPLEVSLGTVDPSAEPEEEVPEVAPAQETPLDAAGRKQVAKVEEMIASGKLQPAKTELNKLNRSYPGAPEITKLRKKLQAAEKLAKSQQERAAAELQRSNQRSQREEERARQVATLLAQGQIDQAGSVVTVWLGENPSSSSAQELASRIETIRKNLQAYNSSLAAHRYAEASTALRNLEQLNPNDSNLPRLRQQLESRRSDAQAYLTIYRLGAKGNLQMDGRAVGRNGELESEKIAVGPHAISVESDGKTVATQNIDFFDGQRLTLVYDVGRQALRPMSENDRATLSRRRELEQGVSFEVEHQHGALRGSCKGSLVVADSTVTFKPHMGDHDFSIATRQIKVGKIDGKTVELLNASSNQKFNSFKFENDPTLQKFRKTLEDVHSMK